MRFTLQLPAKNYQAVGIHSVNLKNRLGDVEPSSGMITIRHDPNGPLDIGQSTDKFRTAEPIVLNALRPGAKVKFAATRIGGELSITKILTE